VHRRGASAPVVEVWAPVRTARGQPVGAAQISLDERVLEDTVGHSWWTIWTAVGLVFGVLWLMLALLVRGASYRLRRQNDDLEARSRELLETTRTLEKTLLETIETLNAAVEARDPYTAGHSQRVRRVALALGRELSLPAKRLGALGNAALFHDVGKIAMPDSILTKPEPLTPAEAAVMREHAPRGAEIVSRLSSLQDSAPAIRHHHERWDGLGYPDGLREDAIPLEAAIIGLADAWDAMTTERPYAVALGIDQAMVQLNAGRGRQFCPAVVDAFLAIARRRPGDVLTPDAQLGPVAASG
jgi:putative nucleotidyltransferase with HDIG domain